jgi:hypothetical protein
LSLRFATWTPRWVRLPDTFDPRHSHAIDRAEGFCNDVAMSIRRRTIVLAGVSTLLIGCAQTASYAPKPITATYRLDNFQRGNLQVVVRDLRAERDNSDALISAIQSQISNSLTERATTHNRYTLTVDVIEHRSYFTLGNWNALTRLKWRVQRENGSIIREGVSVGEGHRSNMAGYLTAGAVSQDAFNVAMADLMSSLSAIPVGA